MRCTNISPRVERTRISTKGNSLVGVLHFLNRKINAGIRGDYVPFKINFINDSLDTTLLFHVLRVEKKLKMTLVSFDVLTSPK